MENFKLKKYEKCGLVDAVMANSSILGLMLKKKIHKKPKKRVIALIKERGKHSVAYVLTVRSKNKFW